MDRERSARRIGIVAAFAAILGVRLCLLASPGYPGDLDTYKAWAVQAGIRGVYTVYDAGSLARFDYPPLDAYLLAPAGWVYARVAPDPVAHFHGSRLLGALVKVAPLAFDVLLACLLAFVGRYLAAPPAKRRSFSALLPLLYLLEPAVAYDSGHWGQPDAVHAFFVLAGLTAILVGRPALAGVATALGCLMKPLAWPFVPLLVLAAIRRGGLRALLRGLGAACATTLVVLLPFIAAGRTQLVVRRIFLDVNAMPFTSVNGHNLWWLLGPWRPANVPWLGPFTATQIGLALFGASYLLVLAGIWRGDGGASERVGALHSGDDLARSDVWFLGAGVLAFAFFFFSTHMHENHLFSAIPFLVLFAHRGPRWVVLALLVGLVSTINMVNHDTLLAPLLYPGDSGMQRLMRDGSLLAPPAMHSVATANSIATAGLFAWIAWAFAKMTRPRAAGTLE